MTFFVENNKRNENIDGFNGIRQVIRVQMLSLVGDF